MKDENDSDEESEVEKDMQGWVDDDYSRDDYRIIPPIHKLPTDKKLDRIYHVLNHLRWIGCGIFLFLALPYLIDLIEKMF